MMRWISVKEQLPEPFVSVLGYDPSCAPLPAVHECYADHGGIFHGPSFYGVFKVTHWMEMPTPPSTEVVE